ncbi:uncharacterized protein Z519_06703 [Cladophialophora bantiana CBS 173.52]|uniref:Peptidase S9 prolyl oligopeptidase catalytic domain-containing protein n=1 Tax=Cladophialophora bantiana (strain ATCC 10958 / CBS 173.52 / CDC B-1940 / NIH 8579) TaxID=1442370 RepID=A0A0D2I7Q6_CLAB1|nr:uncharacterized protein Z519_06703 [Cladophialophora bantiana CBS 173.52]KIW92854.1 hypothetical protein Z519_06703 [Cladophialophora bantiana CBS 173.52]
MKLGQLRRILSLVIPCQLICLSAGTFQDVLSVEDTVSQNPIIILPFWDVLGPFRIGTREAVWGTDPVEFYGGIQNVSPNESGCFRSPLARNATVQWDRKEYNTSTSNGEQSVAFLLDFIDVDWEFAQKIYGWSAFQYQAWAKGVILNQDVVSRPVNIFTDNILEIRINNMHVFGGDFFGFGRAPVLVELLPGANNISVRLVREVRSMGGIFPPTIQAGLRTQPVSEQPAVVANRVVMPNVVNGKFCTRYGSITVQNQAATWISVHQVVAISKQSSCIVANQRVRLAPGQSRPLKLIFDSAYRWDESLKFVLTYSRQGSMLHEIAFDIQLEHASMSSLQRITFLHPSGSVSYALLKPPLTANATKNERLPVLLNLHGAGVEVDDALARHMFDDAPYLPAWILTPTGMSPWSSDDWHTWGFADAQCAVAAIPDWINSTGWNGPSVYSDKLLVAGHSNGGQGTWYFASHQPDRVLGAAVASGYSSIESYVPYVWWNEADPLRDAILQTSRSSFRHEILADNLVGLPIFQQHGSADDNVPPYHSRLMNTLLAQVGEMAEYSEMLDKGHWFDGSMTTKSMMEFYLRHLKVCYAETTVPTSFTFVVPNSHDMGPRYGVVIDQLSTPDRLGKMKVTIQLHESLVQWHLRTENIYRFHLDPSVRLANAPNQVLIDDLPHAFDVGPGAASFVKSVSNVWGRDVALDWKTLGERYGRQRGVLDAILRSAGPFEVVYDSDETLSIAVQTSRNFLQYFGGDTNIVASSRYEQALDKEANVITIWLGTFVPDSPLPGFPIRLVNEQILFTAADSRLISLNLESGMGGVWLRPLPGERLELVVWGVDEVGLRQAARLVPTIAGAGQPDFVILGNEARWKGHGGAIAMGFLDRNWKISSASYLP